IASGQLGDHAAERLVQVDLRVDHVGEYAPPARDHRNRGFVAAGLDAQGQPRLVYYSPSRVMSSRRRPLTSASIRSRLDSYARRKRGEWIESDHITMASSPLSV